ncbi:hypothetical protein C0J52_02294 [Blattella germanica]|nr:hypothetical protein C0J52_02294 [Blattella germanica]
MNFPECFCAWNVWQRRSSSEPERSALISLNGLCAANFTQFQRKKERKKRNTNESDYAITATQGATNSSHHLHIITQ